MDGPTLYAKLNEERLRRERWDRAARKVDGRPWLPYSWSRVSRECGVSVGGIRYIHLGGTPRADTLAKLTAWLEAEYPERVV